MKTAFVDNLNLHLLKAIGESADHDDLVTKAVPLAHDLVSAWNKIDTTVPMPDQIDGIDNSEILFFITHFSTSFKPRNDGDFVLRNLNPETADHLKIFLSMFVDRSMEVSKRIRTGASS